MTDLVNILAIGDPHFSVSTVRETTLMEIRILELIEANPQLTAIIVLGDIHHTHTKINMMVQVRVTDFLLNLSKKLPTYVLVGNHDIMDNEKFLPKEHSLYPLKFIPSLNIIDYPTIVRIGDIDVTMCPFVPKNRFFEALNICPGWRDTTAIFAHQEVNGSVLGNIESTSTDLWTNDMPEGFLGHIHTRCIKEFFRHIGTPYSQNFAETDMKTVSILTYHPPSNPGEQRGIWTESLHSLNIPQHIQDKCTMEDLHDQNPNKVVERLNTILSNTYPSGTKFKLKIHGTEEQLGYAHTLPLVERLAEKFEFTLEKIVVNNFTPVEYVEHSDFNTMYMSYLYNQGQPEEVMELAKKWSMPTYGNMR